jgi:hypothetical protein
MSSMPTDAHLQGLRLGPILTSVNFRPLFLVLRELGGALRPCSAGRWLRPLAARPLPAPPTAVLPTTSGPVRPP